ncbi:PKD domain-containing protein, partial [Candidatus Bipolaricaulota bacterium]|nr:PKD domain-containing protein [Candidatus Bipolaricaulota bacterium]
MSFNAVASYDPDGYITQWNWDFGDGESDTGPTVTHRFIAPGTYSVELSIRDNRRATSEATVTIEVVEFNKPPSAKMTLTPLSGEAPLLVTFNAAESTDADGKIEEWTWDFGDGEQGSGSLVFHRYMDAGTYTVRLTVSDDSLDEDTISAEIVISESRPFQRYFEWDYASRHFDWTVSLPSALYYEYQGRLRGPWVQRDYDEYVLDPLDDEYLESLVDWIQTQVGTDFYATAECAFNFVQGAIDYSYDRSGFEYPRYPIETLVDGTGDCE